MARSPGAKPPWKRGNPKKKAGTSKRLTSAQKQEARTRARAAGRKYPNLVDNMAVARKRATTGKKARSSKGTKR